MQNQEMNKDQTLATYPRPSGARSLEARAPQMNADGAILDKLGLTREIIARRIRLFRAAAETGLGQEVPVAPHFEALMDDARGRLPCPFGDACAFAKRNTTIRNLATDERGRFDLVHLIEDHGCFGDPGSPFRLDPQALARILETARP